MIIDMSKILVVGLVTQPEGVGEWPVVAVGRISIHFFIQGSNAR